MFDNISIIQAKPAFYKSGFLPVHELPSGRGFSADKMPFSPQVRRSYRAWMLMNSALSLEYMIFWLELRPK